METGAITQYVDFAQLVLYLFWIFFFGLFTTCCKKTIGTATRWSRSMVGTRKWKVGHLFLHRKPIYWRTVKRW